MSEKAEGSCAIHAGHVLASELAAQVADRTIGSGLGEPGADQIAQSGGFSPQHQPSAAEIARGDDFFGGEIALGQIAVDQRVEHESGVFGVGFGLVQLGQLVQNLRIDEMDFSAQQQQPAAHGGRLSASFDGDDTRLIEPGEELDELLLGGVVLQVPTSPVEGSRYASVEVF